MKRTNKKRKGVLGKLIAGITVGLATYLYFKSNKAGAGKAAGFIVPEGTKADLFV